MLVQVASDVQAQRLSNNSSLDRHGEKTVTGSFDSVKSILEDSDVTVEKISLTRGNSPEEAAVIDEIINQGYESRVYQKHGVSRSHSTTPRVSANKGKLFSLDADSLTIYRDFESVLDGDVREIIVEKDAFESATDSAVEKYQNKIEQLERKLEDAKESQAEIEQMGFEEWVENGAKQFGN